MRRGPVEGIIFGLALLVQLLVPVMASQHSVMGSSGHTQLCIQGGVSSDADGSGSGGAPPRHEHCGLCQIACSAAGLLTFVSTVITLALPAESRLGFALESEREAKFGSGQHRFPRGPPTLA